MRRGDDDAGRRWRRSHDDDPLTRPALDAHVGTRPLGTDDHARGALSMVIAMIAMIASVTVATVVVSPRAALRERGLCEEACPRHREHCDGEHGK